jgi:GTPase SAR1 family protein
MYFASSYQNTFKTLKNWVDELKAQGPQDIAIAIAGNKTDLEEQRVRNTWFYFYMY